MAEDTRLKEICEKLDRIERHLQPSIWTRFIGGVFAGLGTVVGATVLVSIVVWLAKPLSRIEHLGPMIERLTEVLEQKKVIEPGR